MVVGAKSSFAHRWPAIGLFGLEGVRIWLIDKTEPAPSFLATADTLQCHSHRAGVCSVSKDGNADLPGLRHHGRDILPVEFVKPETRSSSRSLWLSLRKASRS